MTVAEHQRVLNQRLLQAEAEADARVAAALVLNQRLLQAEAEADARVAAALASRRQCCVLM